MTKLSALLTLSVLLAGLSANPSPFAYGTNARQNLAAKAGAENEVLASSDNASLDDSSREASYARGAGASDASVQSSADLHTDSNAVTGSTEGGTESENGFAVSNVKSELSKDENTAVYNTNPKFHQGFPGLPNAEEWAPYRTYTLSTNVVTGNNTNSATRGISSRRNRLNEIGVTSNRSQNDADGGAAKSKGLSLSNANVNNAKVISQLKTMGSESVNTKNDLAAANVDGIGAAVQIGSATGEGLGSEASQIQQGDNIGFGFTQTAGTATANDFKSDTAGHIKAFFNPTRTQAGRN